MAICILCQRDVAILYKHRGIMKCGDCLNGKIEDPRLEDHMSGFSHVALMQDWPDYGKGSSALRKRVNKATKKIGSNVTRDQLKSEMFARSVEIRYERKHGKR